MNERTDKKIYIFWVGPIRYVGRVVDENSTHWVIIDRVKRCKVEVPKTAVRIEDGGED